MTRAAGRSDNDGIFVDGASNDVEGNTIDEATTGIEEVGDGNTHRGNNLWNVVTMYQPATIGAATPAAATASHEISSAQP
jgi:hypothetical protein